MAVTPGPVATRPGQNSHLLRQVIDEVVQPAATQTDRRGEFPRTSIEALAAAGILGMVSSPEVGGGGAGLADAAAVVEQLAGICGSTAMIVLMHYAATAAIEAHGSRGVREEIAAGKYLTSLAFSETGSRSQFWVPVGTATEAGGDVRLDAQKSWVTSAGHADGYVWSSRPLRAAGPMTLWLVPDDAPWLVVSKTFDGLGLRGNASSPIRGDNVRVPADAMLGGDGRGLDIALGVILPWFLVLSAAFSLGIAEAVTAETTEHLLSTRLSHLNAALAEQPVTRAGYARMRLRTDEIRAFLEMTLSAISEGRPEATLRVLEVKALAAEAATEVTDQAMRLCGGSAFRKELGIERHLRDCLAARVMAPTTEALLDFVGRASCGLPLFDEPAQ
jgi:alkylation response protein AidB-like acyl-CoA dehydrogenase